MPRSVFFILAFPPAFMILMLVQMHPTDLPRYVLAGYLVATFPAVAIALLDEVAGRMRAPARTMLCGLAGAALMPLFLGLVADVSFLAKAASVFCGGLAAFLCAVALARLEQPKLARVSA